MPRLRPPATGGCPGGCPGDDSGSVTAALIVLAIILLAVLWADCRCRFDPKRVFDATYLGACDGPEPARERIEASPDGVAGGAPERRSVHAALSRLYSTADVDPLFTGELYGHADNMRNVYGHADNMRNVYAQRTSHGDVWGLTEYRSNGGPGDVGVDVGPFGLAEYGGRQVGFDDGIPENYSLPSTPVRWYRPGRRDYYGPEGPTVYSEGLFSRTEPDHDVLIN